MEFLIGYAVFGFFYMYLNWHHISWRKPKPWQVATLWLCWAPLLGAQFFYESYYYSKKFYRKVKKWWSSHV